MKSSKKMHLKLRRVKLMYTSLEDIEEEGLTNY